MRGTVSIDNLPRYLTQPGKACPETLVSRPAEAAFLPTALGACHTARGLSDSSQPGLIVLAYAYLDALRHCPMGPLTDLHLAHRPDDSAATDVTTHF